MPLGVLVLAGAAVVFVAGALAVSVVQYLREGGAETLRLEIEAAPAKEIPNSFWHLLCDYDGGLHQNGHRNAFWIFPHATSVFHLHGRTAGVRTMWAGEDWL